MASQQLTQAHQRARLLFSLTASSTSEHLKENHKDFRTARSLTQLVGKRRALLNYLKKNDIERYRAIVKALGLRR